MEKGVKRRRFEEGDIARTTFTLISTCRTLTGHVTTSRTCIQTMSNNYSTCKGPFIIINVLKFRFFIEIVLTHPPTPNFDFKILMPFPFPSYSLLSIEYQCTATLLKDRFNGEYYKILEETTKPFVKKHSAFIE